MASLTPTKSSAVLLVLAMMALTYVHSAAIPQSIQDPDHDLDSLKTQPALVSEQSLEEALQSPQGVQDSSDKAVLDVVENDKNLQETMVEESLDRELSDTDDDDDEDDGDDDDDDDDGDGGDDDDGGDEDNDDDEDDDDGDDDDGGDDVISDDSEQELEDLRPGEPANPPPPPPPAALSQPDDVSEDELQDEDIQENELREAEDSAGEYEKALIQGMEDHEESGQRFKQQSTEEKAGTAHEDTSRPDEEDYEGYGLDDDDDDDDDDDEDEDEEDFIEISDVIKPAGVASEVNSKSAAFQSLHEARVLPSNTGFTPKIPESLSPEEGVEPRRPYLDDVIVSEDDVTHDDVKRGDKTMEVPGHPALRVIELNETLYLNNSDDNEPKFRPVRIPDKFEDYDINRDGLISLPEVRHVTGAVEGAREAFRDADRDGDGWVERDEFDLAGWGMQMNPSPTPPPTPPPQRRVVFVPREDLHPSSIPRGPDDVTSRRQYGRRRH